MDRVCDRCSSPLNDVGVCTACGRHTPLTAHERVGVLCEATFSERDEALVGADPLGFPDYLNATYASRVTTGLGEAAIWGWGEIDGSRCAIAVLDFRFMGGSMGAAVGEKVARAFDAATAERAPVVVVTASGGARMQEGVAALVQMAKTAEARRRHAEAGLAQVTLLASPTTGGVYASFASLGDVVIAEPDAHIGFAGPRVVRELTGERVSRETHTAEFALSHGLIDAIVSRTSQRELIGRLLRWLGVDGQGRQHSRPALAVASEPGSGLDAWEQLSVARDPARPKARQILDGVLADYLELRGDRTGADDPAVVVVAGALEASGQPVVAIAQDASGAGMIRPEGFRKASRALRLAGRLGLPVVTLIDTRGAEPGAEAEASGVAAAIAGTMLDMLSCPAPTVGVICGEGGSGGAMSLVPADTVIAWENAVFSVIAPEAAASILHRDPSRGPDLARELKIRAQDLLALGVVDELVAEPPAGAQADPGSAISTLSAVIASRVAAVSEQSPEQRLSRRSARWRHTGSHWLRVQ